MIYALLNTLSDASVGKILIPNYQKELTVIVRESISFLLSPDHKTTSLYSYIYWTLKDFGRNLQDLSSAVLTIAAKENDGEGMKILLEREDCNVNWEDSDGRTSLSLAGENGYEDVAKLLLETCIVDLKLKEQYGRNALSRAAENGLEAIVKLLLESGMDDLNSKNLERRNSPSWASQNRQGTTRTKNLSAERTQAQKTTAVELRHLSSLIRQKYDLDIQMWNETSLEVPDREITMSKMKEADALLDEIYRIVHAWNREDYLPKVIRLPNPSQSPRPDAQSGGKGYGNKPERKVRSLPTNPIDLLRREEQWARRKQILLRAESAKTNSRVQQRTKSNKVMMQQD